MAAFVKTKLKLAREALGKKDWSTALSSANDVLTYEPQNYNALVFSGLAQLELGQIDASEETYVKATGLAPEQILAWQGLSKVYERAKRVPKLLEVLRRLLEYFVKSEDATKSAEILQRILELQREHGSRADIIATLNLFLPSSFVYPVISSLPPPDMTQPTATTTYMTQIAIHNSLPTLEEITSLLEKEEDISIGKEVDRRRMRLSAGKPEDIKNEVGRDIWASSQLPNLYSEIVSHPNTSDELRRSTEAKLFRYKLAHLHATPVSDVEEKSTLRNEVEEMARGVVILGVEDELAWSTFIEGNDTLFIEDYNLDTLRRYICAFPSSSLARCITGYLLCNHIPLDSDLSDEEDEKEEPVVDYEDGFQTALDGFNNSQQFIVAHRLMSELYFLDKDYANTIKIAEAGLSVVARMEKNLGKTLSTVCTALNAHIAISLVHLFPPKHHVRALGMLEPLLASYATHVPALLARGYILRHAGKFADARDLFAKVVLLVTGQMGKRELGLSEREEVFMIELEAREEQAWCDALLGAYARAREGLKWVLEGLEGSDGTLGIEGEEEERKARVWWRLGKTFWDESGDVRAQAYTHFITSLKRSSSFAPAFTSLGIHYLEYASPADPVRASKCFQKAVELDPREGEAARRLAEGFADEREWDLVEVVARRTIEGEGGKEEMLEGSTAAASRYKPVNAWAWKAIGVVELNRNNFGPAIIALQVALRADTDNVDYRTWTRLGEAYARSGRPVAALKALNHSKELCPSDWTTLFFIGDVYRQTGQYEFAISVFEDILASRPDDTGTLLALADSHLSLGKREAQTGFTSRSEESFARAIETSARLLELEVVHGFRRIVWKTIGDAVFELSKMESYTLEKIVRAAVVPISRLVLLHFTSSSSASTTRMAPSDTLSSVANGPVDGSVIMWLAYWVYEYRAKLCIDEDITRSAALYDVAVAAFRACGRVAIHHDEMQDRSSDALKEALRLDPSNEIYWSSLGAVTFESKPKLAQHAFIKALELDRKSAPVWSSLGLFYLYHGDVELANQALYRAQTLDPEFCLAWVGQALCAIENGHILEAKALLEHAVTLPVPIPQAEYEFASRVFKQFATGSTPPIDQLYPAYFALVRYTSRMSKDADGLHLFALVCERLGQRDLALQLIPRAIAILETEYEEREDAGTERRYAIANVNLGRIRLSEADYEGALEAFEVAIGLLSSDDEAKTGQRQFLAQAQARFGVGLANLKLDKLEEALTSFETALAEVPSDLVDVKGHITILLAQTLWAIGGEEAQETAKDQLLECIGQDSGNLMAITTLAAMGIVSQNEELTRATLAEIAEMAVEHRNTLDPERDVERLLVLDHLNQGRQYEALSIFETALSVEPFSREARSNLATHLLQTAHISAAQEVLQAMPPLHPHDMHARTTLSRYLRLLATAHTLTAKGGDETSADIVGVEDQIPQRMAEKSIMLRPWEKEGRITLDFVRAALST